MSLADELIAQMGDAYPELRTGRDTIVQVIRSEEHRFDAVLTSGLPKLEELLDRAARDATPVPGDDAFRLYDTLGLPLDFIEDLASERKLALDRQGFDRAMEAQRAKARASSAFEGKRAEEPTFGGPETAERLRASGDQFEGYTATTVEGATITALLDAEPPPGLDTAGGVVGLRAAGPHAVLPGVWRAGVRHRRPPQRGRHRRGTRGRRCPARRRVAPRAQGHGDRRRAR